jgi:hypothetical protein
MMAKDDVPMHNCIRTESGTPRRRNTSNRTGTMTAPSAAILVLQTADQVLNNSTSSATPRIHANEPCRCMARAALTNVSSVRRDSAPQIRLAPTSLSCANVMSGFEPTRNHVDRTIYCTYDLTHLVEVTAAHRALRSSAASRGQAGWKADRRLRMCNAEWLTLTHTVEATLVGTNGDRRSAL